MCGIVGIINGNPGEFINEANSAIKHRGPDDEGIFVENNIALGHQRLSIVDISANGHQPMFSSDENYILIFNGEIYNHLELRKKLDTKYKFKSTSDTESLLYGLIEFGTDFIIGLNGIFAFSFYNRRTQEVILARDHFGIKPLYIYQNKAEFWFGSEIKSFLCNPKFDKSLDNATIANYLQLLWSANNNTPFKFVKRLEAGHFLKFRIDDVLESKALIPTKYYEIPFTGEYSEKTEESLVIDLENLLLEAVKRQLMADVPIGFFLSGGLDSSALVVMAKKLNLANRLKCYTIKSDPSNNEGFSNDLYYARKVAKHIDIDLIEVPADIDILKDFDKMIYYLDEPQADVAPLNVLNICKKAREDGIKVLISGTAGDELFSGYRRHQAINFEKLFKYIPYFMAKIFENTIKFLPKNIVIFRRINKLANELSVDLYSRLIGYYFWLNDEKVFDLFRQKPAKSIKEYFIGLLKNIPKEPNLLNQSLYWDMKTFLPNHNLNYTDKLSMATGVEVRVPYLDVELVDFACKIPPNLKMKGMTTKYLLRKVMEKYLPHDIIYRSKAGFGGPVRKWITEDLDYLIQTRLSKDAIEKKGIFNSDKVSELINNNKKGKVDASYSILSLLAIDSWITQFIESK